MDEFESGFVTAYPAWHGKAKVLDAPATAEEAIIEAGLDWEVGMRTMTVGGIPITDHFAVQRLDNNRILGIVGKRYVPMQNYKLFSFFDEVVGRKEAIYHTAGSLRNGQIVWILAKLPESYYVIKDDRVDSYILISSSHDGTLAITPTLTNVRVVCMNTLVTALIEARLRIRHTASAEYELRAAHTIMGIATKKQSIFREVASRLLGIQVTSEVLRNMVQAAMPTKREDKEKNKHLAPIELLFDQGPMNNFGGMRGTGWAAYNALTQYVDHVWAGRDTAYRTMFGSGHSIRTRATDALLKHI